MDHKLIDSVPAVQYHVIYLQYFLLLYCHNQSGNIEFDFGDRLFVQLLVATEVLTRDTIGQFDSKINVKIFFSNRLFENPSDENLDIDLFDRFSMHIPCWKPSQMSFVNECTTLFFHDFGQVTRVQSKVLLLLRLLRFGVTRCCFSESSIKIESFSYLNHLCTSKRKKVMAI